MADRIIKPISLGDLYKKEFPPEKWLIENLVTLEGLTLLTGPPESFKSWIMFHIADCVANDKDVFDEFSVVQSSVLIVDEENPPHETQDRFSMLGVVNTSQIYISSLAGIEITSDTALESIKRFCKENNIGLVIFDSLIRLHSGDENASKDMSQVFRMLKSLTTEGISVITTHHKGKEKKKNSDNAFGNTRGSSEIVAAHDSILSISRFDDREDIVRIKQDKSRGGVKIPPFTLSVAISKLKATLAYEDSLGKKPSKAKVASDLIISVLEKNANGLTHRQIIESLLGLSPDQIGEKTIRNTIKSLVRDGRITEKKGEKNSKICYLSSVAK